MGRPGWLAGWIHRRRRRHRTAGEFGRRPRSRLTAATAGTPAASRTGLPLPRVTICGMSFFEQEAEEAQATPRRPPAWFGPPANAIPVVVPLGLVLAQSDDAVIAVPAVQAYPIGLNLGLVVRVRQRAGGRRPQRLMTYDPASDQFVRLGVQFSDGRKATNLHRPRPPRAGEPPAGPLLTPRGSSETEGAWDGSYWLWPLPPPGRLLIVAEWPAHHLSEMSAEIAADPILAAAALAVTLWPEDDDPGGQVGHVPVAGGG
jgi:hypothetical protein